MLLPVREAITASRELAMEQILRYQWTWCVPWCSGRGLVGGVVFIVASSWVTAAVVAELSGRHVRNLCLRSERRAAGSAAQRSAAQGKWAARCRDTCPQWKAPLWSRTGVAGAVKPFTWSEHTLNYSHLSTRGHIDVKVRARLPLSPSALFFRPSFLPTLFLSSAGLFAVVLL